MIPLKKHVQERAHVGSFEDYQQLYRRSIEEPERFWAEQAELLDWFQQPARAGRWDYDEVDFAWYEGGRLNAKGISDRGRGEPCFRSWQPWHVSRSPACTYVAERIDCTANPSSLSAWK